MRAKLCAIGRKRSTVSDVPSICVLTRTAAVVRFLWVSMQPFGGPVVPDV
jgi:hypothetical protein